MKTDFFLVLLLASAALFALFGLSESWGWARRGRRRCSRKQNCVLDDWVTIRSCSKTCGRGYLTQRRSIRNYPRCGGKRCPAVNSTQRYRTVPCNTQCCSVTCLWTWNSWSPCRGCGVSNQTRTIRITQNPSCGGTACPNTRQETRSCNTGV